MTSHGVARPTQTLTDDQRAAELVKITAYRDVETSLREHISSNGYKYTPEAFALTTKLLRLNPEYYTIWNVRRRLLADGLLSKRPPGSKGRRGSSGERTEDTSTPQPQQQKEPDLPASASSDQDALTSELTFTIPLLLSSPKCYWIWNYRGHILSETIARLPVASARRIWLDELALDGKMLTKDRRNFHAWGYRRSLVSMLESEGLGGTSMVEDEFRFTTDKIHGDLSNFSAWHARSRLIPRVLGERGMGAAERRGFFESELDFIHQALNVGPEDQSLWFYHQFLMASLAPTLDDTKYAIVPDFTTEDKTRYVTQEIDEIKELAEDYDDVKWIYEALLEYTMQLGQLRELDDGEKEDLRGWLGKLRMLDPMRRGRWDDVEAGWKFS